MILRKNVSIKSKMEWEEGAVWKREEPFWLRINILGTKLKNIKDKNVICSIFKMRITSTSKVSI